MRPKRLQTEKYLLFTASGHTKCRFFIEILFCQRASYLLCGILALFGVILNIIQVLRVLKCTDKSLNIT